jgi:hypothetical protein
MLNVVFEGYVANRYGFYNVDRSGFKYIHYYLTSFFGYLMTCPKFLKRPKCGSHTETMEKIVGAHFLVRITFGVGKHVGASKWD